MKPTILEVHTDKLRAGLRRARERAIVDHEKTLSQYERDVQKWRVDTARRLHAVADQVLAAKIDNLRHRYRGDEICAKLDSLPEAPEKPSKLSTGKWDRLEKLLGAAASGTIKVRTDSDLAELIE